MQIEIGTRAIAVVYFFLNFFMIFLLLGYRLNLKGEANIRMFVRAKLFQALACAALVVGMYAGGEFLHWAQLATNELLIAAIAFECMALLLLTRTVGKKKAILWYGIGASGMGLAFGIVFCMVPVMDVRIILMSVTALVLVSYPIYILFTCKNGGSIYRIVGSIYLLLLVDCVIRVLVAGGVFTQSASVKAELQSWLMFGLFVLMILSNSGYLLLINYRTEKRLMELANLDELTNILNRRAFNEQSEKSMQYCARKNTSVTFMIFDVDDFKEVNDTFGHVVGDMVLATIAATIRMQLRAYDFFGRYGGDEFAIFLPDTWEKDADIVAERLRASVASRTVYDHTRLKITISIGMVTLVPTSDTSLDTLYQLGDGALYEAKLQGGNCAARPVQVLRRGERDGTDN